MFRIYPYVCNRKQTKDKMKDMKYDIPALTAEAVGLLKALISIPSDSRDEERQPTACNNTSNCKACRPAVKVIMYGVSLPDST